MVIVGFLCFLLDDCQGCTEPLGARTGPFFEKVLFTTSTNESDVLWGKFAFYESNKPVEEVNVTIDLKSESVEPLSDEKQQLLLVGDLEKPNSNIRSNRRLWSRL